MLLMLLLLFATDAAVYVENDANATVNDASFDKDFVSIGGVGEVLDVDADGLIILVLSLVLLLVMMSILMLLMMLMLLI